MPLSTIKTFKIPHLQILDENGQVDPKLDPQLSNEQALALYRGMLHARVADQRMLKLQRQGRVGTFGPCTGQEAAACGPALAMGEKDWMAPAFREVGAMLMRGVPLSRLLLFWGGWEEGNVYPVERILPFAVIVGSQIPIAAGVAYAMKYQEAGQSAVVCFFGDGATSQGDFLEGVNMAAVWKAPAVFICQNNQWAISTPLAKQTVAETIAQKGLAFGIHLLQVDGNDPLAMYQATREALERARAGKGPTLLEAVTYRLMMHTTADDPTKYRGEGEVREWERRDPLIRMRTYLEARGLWSEHQETEAREQLRELVDSEVRVYETMSGRRPEAPFDHVYGTRHEEIEEQRAEFLARRPGEASHG